jgi:hypothetical protein
MVPNNSSTGDSMAPIDTSPHAGEIMQPPERVIPQPKPGEESDEPVRSNPQAHEAEDEPDIAHRPSLPQPAGQTVVNADDGEADATIDGGSADGMKSLKKQRG